MCRIHEGKQNITWVRNRNNRVDTEMHRSNHGCFSLDGRLELGRLGRRLDSNIEADGLAFIVPSDEGNSRLVLRRCKAVVEEEVLHNIVSVL
jgi:hypothetical protein